MDQRDRHIFTRLEIKPAPCLSGLFICTLSSSNHFWPLRMRCILNRCPTERQSHQGILSKSCLKLSILQTKGNKGGKIQGMESSWPLSSLNLLVLLSQKLPSSMDSRTTLKNAQKVGGCPLGVSWAWGYGGSNGWSRGL